MAATDASAERSATADCDAVATTPESPGNKPQERDGSLRALVAAALALPGILPATAAGQTAPDYSIVALRYLQYRDWQPGQSRMSVKNPSLYVLRPLSETLTLEGNVVYDAMSGASPLAFNTLSGASGIGITDYRTAGDIKLTKWFDRFNIGGSAYYSHERDFASRAFAGSGQWWTADKNTTLSFGFGGSDDNSFPTDRTIADGRRQTLNFIFGITQAVNPTAIVQSDITYDEGHGYYSDPYKLLDRRPNHRQTFAWLTRYNQFFPDPQGTLKLAYRWIHDTYGDISNMFEVGWVQPLPYEFAVTPLVRYYDQSSANFWYGPPLGKGFRPGQDYTADNRLAAYGALTGAVNLSKALGSGWVVDFTYSFYRQKPSWRLFGSGSPGIDTFSASWFEVGLTVTY